MPTPIQVSSITNKLRSFFQLRGRQLFTLDETAVPIVSVEDLTQAPYRENHQVRFLTGFRETLPLNTRIMYFFINTSPPGLSPINEAAVPGVAVIESLRIRSTGAVEIAPIGASQLRISLVSHAGILASITFLGITQNIGSNVDSMRETSTPGSPAVQGRVPVNLNLTDESIGGPALGTARNLGRDQIPTLAGGAAQLELIPKGGGIVVGKRVALLIRGTTAATAGEISVNIQGSYYPLVRNEIDL